MKMKRFSVILAVLIVAILALGAVSAESIDNADSFIADDSADAVSIDSIDDVSVQTTDKDVKNSLGATSVGNESSAEESSVYEINDDSYSTYFNDDGTPTDKLDVMGNYTLNIGTLANKDMIIDSGSNINITAKENAGIINNGTLTIGDGSGMAASIIISGLSFNNVDKNGIIVNDKSTGVSIIDNSFDLTYTADYAASPMAIVTYGYVYGTEIVGNNITMDSAASYTYGIDLSFYFADFKTKGESNAEEFYIANNKIVINSSSQSGMAEAMYLDTIANSVIENNDISVTTVGTAANYGMQVADSWGFFKDPFVASPYNITISENTVILDSADMAYGITVISLWPLDEDYGTIVKDMVISDNNVIIDSQKGAIGIGAKSADVEITNNQLIIKADSEAINAAFPDPAFGNETVAIIINNSDENIGLYGNNTVTDNIIYSNIDDIKVNKTEEDDSRVEPLVIEDNVKIEEFYIVDDDSYSTYFNDDGTAKDTLDELGGYTLFISEINNKDMVIDSGSAIEMLALGNKGIINNGTVTIGDGAGSAGTILISGLKFTNENKNGIIVNDYSTGVSIIDNSFDLTYTADYAASPMAIVTYGYVYGTEIVGNNITMDSAASYTYGIDLSFYLADFKTKGESNAEEFYIANNKIVINSSSQSGMAEAMYLDTIANSVIENNDISVTTVGTAANYGMQVADSWGFVDYENPVNSAYNITLKNNTIALDSEDMAYGITVISLSNMDMIESEDLIKDMVIAENNISINSDKGAIAIGAKTSDVKITDNTIEINADDEAINEAYADPAFGNESVAIFINNFDNDNGNYYNNTVSGNKITANVLPIKVTKDDEDVEPLTIENNEIPVEVSVENTVDATSAKIGQTITYTINVTNAGPNTASDIVVNLEFSDLVSIADEIEGFDAETGVWTIDKLGVDESQVLTIEAEVISEGTIVSKASVASVSKYEQNAATDLESSNSIVSSLTVIDDNNYANYFDESGNIKEDAPLAENYPVLLGDLTNKKLNIDMPLLISAEDGAKLVNTTIALKEGADGTEIRGLTFEFTGDENTGSVGIIYALGVSDISIVSNKITVPQFVDKAGAKYGSSLYAIEVESGSAGCNNILIDNNIIEILGSSRYLYGIDVFKTWGSEKANSNVNITFNTISIDPASRMSEAIYTEGIDNAIIANNTILSEGDAAAYGIGTVSLTNSVIADNEIEANAGTQAYGITSSQGDKIEITNNIVKSNGVGAVGIGFSSSNVNVEGNDISIVGGDYTSITSADSLGTANAAILDKGTGNTIGENKITQNVPVILDDSTYSTYFDENGNIKNTSGIKDGDLILIGNLSNKALNINVPLTLKGMDGNKLANTTIALKDGADGTSITGLDMDYKDNGSATFAIISVNDGVSDVVISGNTISAETAQSWNYNMAIAVYGATEGSKNITISDNTITMTGNAGGLYAIDVQNYDPNWNKGQGTTGLTITDNTISVTGTGMVEPIYISNCNDILVDGNDIISASSGADAYAIGTASNNNFTVTNNNMEVTSSKNMAYGIASPDSTDVIIDNNNISATGVGAVGIGLVNDNNVEIDGNEISITGEDYTAVSTYEKIGTGNAAILNKSANEGLVIGNNTIVENAPVIVDDNSYDKYFDEKGNIKDDAPIKSGDTILIGQLSDKNLIIDVPVTIKPATASKLTDSTISVVEGADGTVIDGLNIEFAGDENTGSVGIIYVNGADNVTISNNNITVPNFVNKEGAKWGSSIYAIEVESGSTGTNNVAIVGNNIEINGTANYLYGIDAFTTWGANTTNSKLTVDKNNVVINGGSRMAEAIYVSDSKDVEITNNNVSSTSDAAAYGIATDQLKGAEIANNTVAVDAGTTGYGITATTSGKDLVMESNDVAVKGTSAVGIGLSGQDNTTLKDNDVEIVGGDYASVSSADNLGTANAAILDKDNKNTNLALNNNTLSENGKAVNATHNGNASSELQSIIDAAAPGSTVDLGGVIYSGVSDVVINKNLTITNGTISGKGGETVFVIPAKSEGGPDEVTITGVNFLVNNANTIVKASADNGTTPSSIDTPAITITNNTVTGANDDVVAGSVTVLELESERGALAPTSPITVEGNTLDSGVDPFEFTVTGVTGENGDTVINEGGNIPVRQATVIQYQDMVTTAVNTAIEGRVGKYFEVNLTDANGNPLANKAVQIGFNGKIYNRTTNATGGVSLQINLAKKGTYTFAISFLGDDNYNASFEVSKITVNTQKTKLTTANKSYKASAKTKTLTATLYSGVYNKAISGKTVKFTVNGKTYSVKTNSKGVASVKVSLSAKKTYSFTAKFAGDDRYTSSSVKGKVTIK